eukprot:GSChrysophyteH2.ASY1.ANO1.497.1 assembled CDS
MASQAMEGISLGISIPTTSTLADSDSKFTSFEVTINSPFTSWKLHRRYRQFNTLNSQLLAIVPKSLMPGFPKKKVIGLLQQSFVEERRDALETYLRHVLLIPNALSFPPVVEFLEHDSGTLKMHVQMMEMKSKLKESMAANTALQGELHRVKKEQRHSAAMVDFLTKRLEKENPDFDADPGNTFIFVDTEYDNTSLSAQSSAEKRDFSNITDMSEHVDSPKPGYFIKQMLGLDKDVTVTDNIDGDSDRGSMSGAVEGKSFIPEDHHWPGISTTSRLDTMSADSDNTFLRRVKNIVEIIPPALLNFSANKSSLSDRLADEIVTMVEPQESQIQYRVSATRFLSKYTRKILGAQVFEMGLQGLRCFLPDDPIRLSVFLNRGTEAGWHIRLNEHLCRLSGGSLISEDAETVTTRKHQLSNVSFVSTNEMTGHKLQCLVDSVLGVEVLANVRLELCLMAFFEDFDRLFGKDHVFKRSLILIRAWWIYEANMSSACGISDSAFCIMILSILNRFHSKIHHPFHALCYFLAEFSTLDFSKFVITIDGPLPVDSFLTTGPRTDSSVTLISTEYLHRYRKLTLAIDDDESSTMDLLNETLGDGSLSDASFVSNRIRESGTQSPTVCAFTHKPIMIAHPLLPGMIFDGPVMQLRKKSLIIIDEIRAAAHAIVPLLGAKDSSGSELNEHEMIEKFFQNITARFGRGWRPDIPSTLLSSYPSNNSVSSLVTSERSLRMSGNSQDFQQRISGDRSSSDIYWISLDKLWERIKYCNLLLESQISESGLRTLSRQVLEEKQPLPVGEIGKMLQEACLSITNMSTVLKERFGGLKKFLESYADDFILANDHPFNPNVYLKDSLSMEELGMVMRGEPLLRASQWTASKSKKLPRGHRDSGGSSGRPGLNRKKTASPALAHLSSELGVAPGQNFRAFSSDSMNRNRRPSYPAPGGNSQFSSMAALGSSKNVESPLPPRHNSTAGSEPSDRMRSASGSVLLPPDTSVLYAHTSSLGQMGMPDPRAPAWVPTSRASGNSTGSAGGVGASLFN